MKLIFRLLINIFALYIVDYLIVGFDFASWQAALVAAVVIGLVNTFIRPILQIIALPITLVTFGLFAIFINVLLLWLVGYVVPGFTIDSLTTALIASILLSFISWFLNKLAKD